MRGDDELTRNKQPSVPTNGENEVEIGSYVVAAEEVEPLAVG